MQVRSTATQASLAATAGPSPYAGRSFRQRGAGGGQFVNQRGGVMPTGGTATVSAHGGGIANVARSMNGNQPSNDTRADRTRIDQMIASSAPVNSYSTDRDSNSIDNMVARNSPGSMVGDHTTPPALRKYLD